MHRSALALLASDAGNGRRELGGPERRIEARRATQAGGPLTRPGTGRLRTANCPITLRYQAASTVTEVPIGDTLNVG
jgi:hypothetical protein